MLAIENVELMQLILSIWSDQAISRVNVNANSYIDYSY